MKIICKEIHDLKIFPTEIFVYQFDCDDLINKAKTSLLEEYKNSEFFNKPITRMSTYSTADDLNFRDEYAEVTDLLSFCFKTSLDKIGVEYDDIYIPCTWANIYENMGKPTHEMHNHANSFLSCVFYLSVPSESDKIVFEDPRQQKTMTVLSYTKDCEHEQHRGWVVKPKAGMVIVFPSWLRHQAIFGEWENSDDKRIGISSNMIAISESRIHSMTTRFNSNQYISKLQGEVK